jgi:glycosyltransferase involved in cell wall biosynthesis
MSDPLPLISVVIPTHLRPELLLSRALPSARAQRYPNLEIVVVVDGPDPVTISALNELALQDPRIRPLPLPNNVGGSDARNAGVQAARGEWIAFLDDDDEWLPHNLEQQLGVAIKALESGQVRWPVSVCGSLTRTEQGDTPSPPRLPDPGELVCDYMMARRTAYEHECGFMTSAIFCSRELMLACPFEPGLPRQQDCDWVLRASALPQVEFFFTQQIATIWYFGGARQQISTTLHWPQSLDWILQSHRRGLVTGKAMAGFINGNVAAYAQRHGQYGAFLPLTRAMILARPRAFEWLRFAFIWSVPASIRQGIRQFRSRLRTRPGDETPEDSSISATSVLPSPLSVQPTGTFIPKRSASEHSG